MLYYMRADLSGCIKEMASSVSFHNLMEVKNATGATRFLDLSTNTPHRQNHGHVHLPRTFIKYLLSSACKADCLSLCYIRKHKDIILNTLKV